MSTQKTFSTKTKKCKVCGSEFTPSKPMQRVCSLSCALSIASLAKAKRERTALAADKKLTREKLDAMKSKGRLVAEAQVAFNRYIRLRDAGLPCICCGQPMGEGVHGGAVDAGHYRSRGSAVHLSIEPTNVHKQCVRCNLELHGNLIEYRKGLVARYGVEYVEAIEADERARHYTPEEFTAMKLDYRAKVKEMRT